MGSGKLIRSAIEKYGIENFEKETLFQFDNEADMNTKEAELVTEDFVKEDTNYNLCPGGHGGFGYINSNTEIRNGFEKRPEDNKILNKRAIDSLKKLHQNDEWKHNFKENVSKGLFNYFEDKEGHFTGKTHSEETKQKMRKPKNQGKSNSQFGTMWITDGKENKKIRKETDIIPKGWHKGRVLKID
jgi:hypothetical protein